MGESGGTQEVLNEAKTDQYTLTLGNQMQPQKIIAEKYPKTKEILINRKTTGDAKNSIDKHQYSIRPLQTLGDYNKRDELPIQQRLEQRSESINRLVRLNLKKNLELQR